MKNAHTLKRSNINGKRMQYPEYWCGKRQTFSEFHFTDAQHLALSVGGNVQPCLDCVESIINELQKELE